MRSVIALVAVCLVFALALAAAPASASSLANASRRHLLQTARPSLVATTSTPAPALMFSFADYVADRVPTSSLTFSSSIAFGVSVQSNFALGFPFYLNGTAYTTVNFGSRGNLQFSSAVTGVVPAGIPTAALSAPILAWFGSNLRCWTPAYQGACKGGITTLGSAPTRTALIRVEGLTFDTAVVLDSPINIDIVLHETTNVIEVRYYAVPTIPANFAFNVTVGLQLSASNSWLCVFNRANNRTGEFVNFNATEQLQGRTLWFTPVSNAITPLPLVATTSTPAPTYTFSYVDSVATRVPTSSLTFSASVLFGVSVQSNLALGFTLNLNGVAYTTVNLSNRGNLQFSSAVTGIVPAGIPTSALSSPILAWFGSNLRCWTATYQGACKGGITTLGAAPTRTALIRFEGLTFDTNVVQDSPIDIDILLYETTNVIEVRYYTVPNIPTNFAFNVTVGLQFNATNNWVCLFNRANNRTGEYINFNATERLQGRTVFYTPAALPGASSATPQVPLQSSVPQVPVQSSVPQVPLASSVPQAPLESSVPQMPLMSSVPQIPLQSSTPQDPSASSAPSTSSVPMPMFSSSSSGDVGPAEAASSSSSVSNDVIIGVVVAAAVIMVVVLVLFARRMRNANKHAKMYDAETSVRFSSAQGHHQVEMSSTRTASNRSAASAPAAAPDSHLAFVYESEY